VFDPKKRQHNFGNSAGEQIWFYKLIMVNIEDLSKEDQRKYTVLQEYIKQQFLSGARKDRSGKVTMTQDFELPAIKVNNDKIEVITTVSKPEIDLSTKLTEISDKFERVFSNQHSQVAKMFARLAKIEGKSSSLNFPNDSIPQIDSQGVLQTSLSAASGTSVKTLVHGMPTSFYLGQPSLSEPTPVRPPPMAGLTAPSGQMMGVPGNPPLVNKVDLSAARQSQLAGIDELNKFKEQVASMVKNKFGIDMGSSKLYQKPYKAEFDLMAYRPGWRVPDFIKFSAEDDRTTWEHISQYIAQLGEASAHESSKVRLFFYL
jgi:hypothetical protein